MKSITSKYSNDLWRNTGFSHAIDELLYDNLIENEHEMIREMPNYYHLEIPVPGMSKNDLTLRLEDRVLIVEGQRKFKWQNDSINAEQQTNYRRSMFLPVHANTDQIKAKVKNGMLTVKIFKQKQHNNIRAIPVSGDGRSDLTKNNIWLKKMVQDLKNNFRKLFK
ncbi:MAG: Hsp20/alpha crystallin family protein [Cyclobacteriaceae bacterium]